MDENENKGVEEVVEPTPEEVKAEEVTPAVDAEVVPDVNAE